MLLETADFRTLNFQSLSQTSYSSYSRTVQDGSELAHLFSAKTRCPPLTIFPPVPHIILLFRALVQSPFYSFRPPLATSRQQANHKRGLSNASTPTTTPSKTEWQRAHKSAPTNKRTRKANHRSKQCISPSPHPTQTTANQPTPQTSKLSMGLNDGIRKNGRC